MRIFALISILFSTLVITPSATAQVVSSTTHVSATAETLKSTKVTHKVAKTTKHKTAKVAKVAKSSTTTTHKPVKAVKSNKVAKSVKASKPAKVVKTTKATKPKTTTATAPATRLTPVAPARPATTSTVSVKVLAASLSAQSGVNTLTLVVQLNDGCISNPVAALSVNGATAPVTTTATRKVGMLCTMMIHRATLTLVVPTTVTKVVANGNAVTLSADAAAATSPRML